jgi:hypothetical protein
MFAKDQLIKEFKNRNINAILLININDQLNFYVNDETTKESINDLMFEIKPVWIYHAVHIVDVVSTGLSIVELPPSMKKPKKPKSFLELIKVKIKSILNQLKNK